MGRFSAQGGRGGLPGGSRSGGKPGGCGRPHCCLPPPRCGASFCGGTGCCGAETASWNRRCANVRPNWNRNAPRWWKRRGAPTRRAKPKGRFLATMSHEIRTPLNGVIGLSRLLEAMPVPAEAREMVRMIRSSGDALLRVINDVLDFSKVEAGKLELEVAPFHLRRSLEESIGLFRALAAEKRPASRLRTGAGIAGMGSRRRHPVAASGTEPGLKRAEVYQLRRGCAVGRGGTAGRGILLHRDRGSRHRYRDCPGSTASPILIVSSGGRLDQPSLRGNRPGSGDLEAAGRVDGRPNRCGIQTGRGHAVPIHGSNGSCGGTGGGARCTVADDALRQAIKSAGGGGQRGQSESRPHAAEETRGERGPGGGRRPGHRGRGAKSL